MSEIKAQKDRIEHLMTKAGIKSQVSLLQQIQYHKESLTCLMIAQMHQYH